MHTAMNATEKRIADMLNEKSAQGVTTINVEELKTLLNESQNETYWELRKRAAAFVEEDRTRISTGKAILTELLTGKPTICFDWENEDAPCISASGIDGDDITDCHVTRIWVDGGVVFCNIRSYYLGEERFNVVLEDVCVDCPYGDLIDYVLSNT